MTMGNEADHVGGNPLLLFQHLCSGSLAIQRFTSSHCLLLALCLNLISVHARKNIFGYRMMVWAIVIIGALELSSCGRTTCMSVG